MSEILKKYIIKNQKEDVFHTSGFSKAQSGNNMGSASTETFSARQALERNRQHIKGYHHSTLMGRNIVAGSPHPKTYTPERRPNPIRPPKSPGI
ncbi:hypothetical protein IJS18_00955 [Candidatus Saccharibacteria bacterium]|nr:hypothetical protein [Candidatus Saccharibacteria bacterium]